MNYILDAILILLVLVIVIVSGKKGFLSASKNIVALILTAILLATMQGTVLTALQNSPINGTVRTIVAKKITKTYEEKQISENIYTDDTEKSNEACEALGFPSFMEESIKNTVSRMTEIKNNVMEVVTDSVTIMILKVIGMLLVFLIVKLMVFLIMLLLGSLFKLPGLRSVNRLLGTVLGMVNAMLVIYLVLGAVSLFAPAEKMQIINDSIQGTYLVKYFYEHNMLLSLLI